MLRESIDDGAIQSGILFEYRRNVSESHTRKREIGNDPDRPLNSLSEKVIALRVHRDRIS